MQRTLLTAQINIGGDILISCGPNARFWHMTAFATAPSVSDAPCYSTYPIHDREARTTQELVVSACIPIFMISRQTSVKFRK